MVELAAAWLRERRYTVVVTDLNAGGGELADAVGFDSFRSCLIECKSSRSDFANDAKKVWRQREVGTGGLRYYLVPAGLLKPSEVPEKWGLLEDRGGGAVAVLKESKDFLRDPKVEVGMLVSAMRRMGVKDGRGLHINTYEIPKRNHGRATVGVEPGEAG